MDSCVEECPTGILVDFEETTIAVSSDCNRDLSDSNAVLLNHGTEEPSLGCQTVFVNGDDYKISSDNCLGAELNCMKDECFSNIEWRRSPSPTTMNMIATEASKIVDQLHTTLETTLWEEEFSLSLVSEDEYFDDASYKGSSRDKSLKVSGNIVEEGSCFRKGNGSNSFNLVVANSQVNVDNSVYKDNKTISQTDLTIDTCVDNENLVPSKEIYTAAKKYTESSSENSLKCKKTVSIGKNCVNECSTTTSLNYDLSKENKVCCSIENYSASTEDNSSLSEVKSNVITEVSSVHFNAKNLALTEESNIPHEVTEKCSSDFSVINSIVSFEVNSDSNASAKESNEILKTDSAALTNEIDANNEVGGHAANKVECNATNEDNGNVPTEDDDNALIKDDCIAPNEDDDNVLIKDDCTAPNEDDGNALIKDDCIAPNEDDGNAPIEDDDIAPNEVVAKAAKKVEGNAVSKVDGNVPHKIKNEISTTDNFALIEVDSQASSNGMLCASDEINDIHIRGTCNGTKEISKYSEISNTVNNGNLDVFQKLPAQTSKANKDKIMKTTPLTGRSKFSKIFKAPYLKSPFKSKSEEKENTDKDNKQNSLSEKNLSKIGKMPSAKGVLSASTTKGSMTLTSKSSIKTPLNKSSIGKVLIGSENKMVKVSQDEAKQKLQTFDTPLKRMSLAKFQPPSNGKTPLGKSYSLRAKTPNTGTTIRRSSSFQTNYAENAYQLKKERSFIMESRTTNFNSRMSLAQTQPIGNKLRFETPSKIGPFLPKTSAANPTTFGTPFSSKANLSSKELQSCKPPFGSAIRPIKVPNQNVPEVVGLKRPASTTSKSRFTSRLELPSPLPKVLNDNLSRRLFPDYSTPLKRRV